MERAGHGTGGLRSDGGPSRLGGRDGPPSSGGARTGPAGAAYWFIVKCSVSFRNGISSHGLGWAIIASRTIASPSTP